MELPMRSIDVATLICSLAAPALAEDWADAPTLQTLSGTWVSPAVEPWYGGFGTREFVSQTASGR